MSILCLNIAFLHHAHDLWYLKFLFMSPSFICSTTDKFRKIFLKVDAIKTLASCPDWITSNIFHRVQYEYLWQTSVTQNLAASFVHFFKEEWFSVSLLKTLNWLSVRMHISITCPQSVTILSLKSLLNISLIFRQHTHPSTSLLFLWLSYYQISQDMYQVWWVGLFICCLV